MKVQQVSEINKPSNKPEESEERKKPVRQTERQNENDPAAMRQVYLDQKTKFEEAAAAGNPAANRLLGNMYYHDWLGEPDYDKAEELYRRAVTGGDSIAKLCLANLWLEGHGHGSAHEALELVSQCAKETGRVVIRHENPDGTTHYGLSTSQKTIPVRRHT